MNIEQYKKRFYNLMESELGNVKPLMSEQLFSATPAEIITSASDWGVQMPDLRPSNQIGSEIKCVEEKKDYEIVVEYINWCRYNPKADKSAWEDNWQATEVKTDVNTTSTEDKITPAIATCKTAQVFCQFVNSYYKYKGDLYNDLDNSVIMYDKWNRIIASIQPEVKKVIFVDPCKKYEGLN